MMLENVPSFAVGEQIREYKILEQTSESDIETVYRVMHVFLDEERAFKVIRTQLADPGYRDRFIREAKLFSKLRHKNLVRLYEFGTLDENTFFVVFEYVHGERLAARIAAKGKIPYWDAIRMVRETAEGLQVAHKQNLIHNNFSADCLILVTTPEGNEITKLINFSLARPGRTETSIPTSEVLKNLEYSPPESFTAGDEIDQRSDIYSLGVILYEMISGSVPFRGETAQEVIDLHLKGESQDLADVPPLLNQILRKALSKSKEERHSALQEFIHDLNRVPPPETANTWSGDTLNTAVPDEFPPGLQIAQRYVIESLIGKGGMGTVYKARDRVLNVPVALKSINKNITNSERMVQRLKREVILARKVAHPNVCRIYDIGQENRQHYVTMEYLEGKTLAEMLSERPSLPTEKGIPILKQLFLGLQEAHRVGVIHRDLKPQNIMVDVHGRAFLMDFGISISEEVRRLTESGIVIGTPWYMAPEQFSTPTVGPPSDIYSMGIIMFEMFTGRLPYEAKTPATVMNAHLEGKLFKPSAVADVHPALEKVILKALATNPAERYQTVADLLADLEATEDTPYAATLIVSRPTVDQETKPVDTTPPALPEEPAGPWAQVLRMFDRKKK